MRYNRLVTTRCGEFTVRSEIPQGDQKCEERSGIRALHRIKSTDYAGHGIGQFKTIRWGGSSVGRALRSQCRGRGFDSPPLHLKPDASCERSAFRATIGAHFLLLVLGGKLGVQRESNAACWTRTKSLTALSITRQARSYFLGTNTVNIPIRWRTMRRVGWHWHRFGTRAIGLAVSRPANLKPVRTWGER